MGKEVIQEELVVFLEDILPGIDFASSDTLVDDGIIDSLAITTIISEISMEYDINIPFEELSSKNFNSIKLISELIGRCMK